MRTEPHYGEQPKFSADELQRQIEALTETVDVFGKDSPKGMEAIEKRAKLQAQLKQMESGSADSSEETATWRAQLDQIDEEELAEAEVTEKAAPGVASTISTLLSASYSHPELIKVTKALRDSDALADFFADRRGVEYFLQGVQDSRAIQVARRELEDLYQRTTKRPYQAKRAA